MATDGKRREFKDTRSDDDTIVTMDEDESTETISDEQHIPGSSSSSLGIPQICGSFKYKDNDDTQRDRRETAATSAHDFSVQDGGAQLLLIEWDVCLCVYMVCANFAFRVHPVAF